MKVAKSPIKELFIVLNEQGEQHKRYSGVKVYVRRYQAVAQCPPGGMVLRIDSALGEVIHEEPKK
jgi:hypothetical protein